MYLFIYISYQVKVVNEQNEIVPVNTPGELCVRGYSVMLKYWDDVEKTNETIAPDRWLRTGYYTNIRLFSIYLHFRIDF